MKNNRHETMHCSDSLSKYDVGLYDTYYQHCWICFVNYFRNFNPCYCHTCWSKSKRHADKHTYNPVYNYMRLLDKIKRNIHTSQKTRMTVSLSLRLSLCSHCPQKYFVDSFWCQKIIQSFAVKAISQKWQNW